MVKIAIEYAGELHCRALHGPSGTALDTDAPVDNRGRGASFSPTDLVATALGTCMATTMAIYVQIKNLEIDLTGMRVEVSKEMSPPPRRIARLITEIWMPAGVARNAELERVAEECPVQRSLAPEVETPVTFHWQA